MDPTANLERQLDIARAYAEGDIEMGATTAATISNLVLALHEWLTQGGFLPEQWGEVELPNGVTRAQAITLGSKVIDNDITQVTRGGAGLPASYLYVTYNNDPFVLGIDREGRASS